MSCRSATVLVAFALTLLPALSAVAAEKPAPPAAKEAKAEEKKADKAPEKKAEKKADKAPEKKAEIVPAAAVAPVPPPAVEPPPPPAAAQLSPADRDALRLEIRKQLLEEMEDRLDTAKEEMRDEVRAAVTSANASETWDQSWEEDKPKLEFFEPHGYFRTRMDLFDNFDLNTGRDPSDNFIFPVDPLDPNSDSIATANMRLRFEPTLNVSEEVRIKMQIDAFDNLILGSTPEGGFDGSVNGNKQTPTVVFSGGQLPPRYAWNAITDSITAKRAWAEVRTPVGELRFGRMGSQWGLGILANDGNCLDCDAGDTQDRILFATKIADHVIAPALDFVSEGPTSANTDQFVPTGQPFDRTQLDDARNYILAVARRDKDDEIRKKRLLGQTTFINYGVYFVYREQSWDAPALNVSSAPREHGNAGGGSELFESGDCAGSARGGTCDFVPREAWAVIPDVWFRLLHKSYRLEIELVTIQGNIGNRSVLPAPAGLGESQAQSLDLEQYAGVIQNEIKLLDDKLSIGLEIGYASGDSAPGFGNVPGRVDPNSDESPFPQRGDWEGQQFNCTQPECKDANVNNFRFDRDYRVDMILFREILGGVTDAVYVKPSVRYDVTEGLNLNLAILYSQANEAGTTPTGDLPLGVEINTGINYVSDDGFVAGLRYGVLFPLSGLSQVDPNASDPAAADVFSAETAQSVRGLFGVTY